VFPYSLVVGKRYLGVVVRAHALLDHAVDPASFQHGIRGDLMYSVVYVTGAQDELHQAPD
jgi:hypothetical protein